MNKYVKVGIVTALIVGAIYLAKKGADKISEWAEKISIAITAFGTPQISGGKISLPVYVRITNGTPIEVQIDNIGVQLYYLLNNIWKPFGGTEPTGTVIVKSGDTDVVFKSNVDLSKLQISKDVTSLLTSQNPLLAVKAELKITIGSEEIIQDFQKSLYLKQITGAA